jgi:hypothetical protein
MPEVEPSVSPCNIDNLSDHYLLQHLALASSQFERGETRYQQLQSWLSLREIKPCLHGQWNNIHSGGITKLEDRFPVLFAGGYTFD